MFIVKAILIVDKKNTHTTAEVFFSFFNDRHSMRYRRLILLTNSARSIASSLDLAL